VWFPVNHLVMGALERFHRGLGDDFTVEFPRGSGRRRTLAEVSLDLGQRLVAIFLKDASAGGRRPVFGGLSRFQDDRRGMTRCASTSTSTATTAPGFARRIRPAGPAWSPI
jgi:hypothetical protein